MKKKNKKVLVYVILSTILLMGIFSFVFLRTIQSVTSQEAVKNGEWDSYTYHAESPYYGTLVSSSSNPICSDTSGENAIMNNLIASTGSKIIMQSSGVGNCNNYNTLKITLPAGRLKINCALVLSIQEGTYLGPTSLAECGLEGYFSEVFTDPTGGWVDASTNPDNLYQRNYIHLPNGEFDYGWMKTIEKNILIKQETELEFKVSEQFSEGEWAFSTMYISNFEPLTQDEIDELNQQDNGNNDNSDGEQDSSEDSINFLVFLIPISILILLLLIIYGVRKKK